MSDTTPKVLEPLPEEPPATKLRLPKDEEEQLWQIEFAGIDEPPMELR